jgi:galactonate dehydratase
VAWRNDVVDEPIPLNAGQCAAPTRPGLGIDINEAEARKHPFEPEVLMAYHHRDGSVADW